MEQPQMTNPVPRSALHALRSRADNAGLSMERLAGELGFEYGGAEDSVLPLAGFLKLQSRLTAVLDDETGRLSKRQLLSGSTELALARLPARGSLVDAMETVARSYNLLHAGEFNSVERRGDQVAFVIDDTEFPYAVDDEEQVLFVMETTLLFAHALLRLIVPAAAATGWRGVELKRSRGPARVPFEDHVTTVYRQGAYALLYDASIATRVYAFPPSGVITRDAVTDEQIRLLRGGIDDLTYEGRVRLLIEDGVRDQSAVARALGMSVATLRRRLTDEGINFRNLRTEALKEQAGRLLATSLPLSQVAERLGFSDVRSFSRAFKAWTGFTPNAARRSAQP